MSRGCLRGWRAGGLILAAALSTALPLAACCRATAVPVSDPSELLGKAPAPVQRPAIEGGMVRFPEPGKVTVVDFWSTQCEPCVPVMKALEELHRQVGGDELLVVGVAIDDRPVLVQRRVRELGLSYANVLDSMSRLQGAYRVSPLPHTCVIDGRGVVRYVGVGEREGSVKAVVDAVRALLRERRASADGSP